MYFHSVLLQHNSLILNTRNQRKIKYSNTLEITSSKKKTKHSIRQFDRNMSFEDIIGSKIRLQKKKHNPIRLQKNDNCNALFAVKEG